MSFEEACEQVVAYSVGYAAGLNLKTDNAIPNSYSILSKCFLWAESPAVEVSLQHYMHEVYLPSLQMHLPQFGGHCV